MKFKKQILSFILAVMLVMNCSPLVYATENGVLSVGDIYNAITNIEYGWDGTTYRFPNDVLTGVKDGDDVYLIADSLIKPTSTEDTATKDQLKAGSKLNMTLTNFRLEGTDAVKYEKPTDLNGMSVNKDIEIIKKKIKIAPEHPYIYYGQNGPNRDIITTLVDYKDQIINGDEVNIAAAFLIKDPNYNNCGEYEIELQGVPIVYGTAVANYDVVSAEGLKYNVFEYTPDKIASSDEASGNYVGVATANLYAPKGFQISKNNIPNYGWDDKITIPLYETNAGECTYYLRNNDDSDPEYYQAISEEKTYEYKSLQTIPEVYKVEINKTAPNTILNFLTFGVFGNGEITVTVYAEGGKAPVDTTIYLGENSIYEPKVVKAEDAVLTGEKYIYSAKYKFNVDEGKSITKNFKAYAENACGAGAIYPPNATNDKFHDVSGSTDTNVNLPVTIDRKPPEVNSISIDGNYNGNSVRAEFTISDPGSGIAKIEYFWDKDAPIGDSKYQNDFLELPINADNSPNYELERPWDLLKEVEGNRHSLTLRITDNAGNISKELPVFDSVGSDMLNPNIDSIVLRDPRNGATDDQIEGLKYCEYGSFFKYPLDIIVKVNDNEDKKSYHASGVDKVYISNNGKNTELERIDETNEFILSLPLDTIVEDLKITAIDGNGLPTSQFATSVKQHGLLKSNNLIIEQNHPLITFDNFENIGHKDNEGKIWFGKDDKEEKLIVKINDSSGLVHSGLHSVVIKDKAVDNTKPMDSIEKSYSFKTNEDTIEIDIASLSDGEHNIEVNVIDNCGNPSTKNVIFYKDTISPEDGVVSADTTNKEDYKNRKVIDTNIWFNRDTDITFEVATSDDRSGIKEILLSINGELFKYNTKRDPNDTFGDIVFTGEGKCYISASTANIAPENQQFVVQGKITDFANNTADIQQLTVYKDFENPTIDKITVEKKSDALDKILSVLTFGIYSNDTLIVKAHSHEPQNDSGIDYATIKYTGLDEDQKMIDEGNGVFSCELSANDKVFESFVVIKVYDKFGKINLSSPAITDVDGKVSSGKNLVMIENVDPVINPILPNSESIGRSDTQFWYSEKEDIKESKDIVFEFSDADSGLSNIDLTINGVMVKSDKNGVDLLKSDCVEKEDLRNNAVQRYVFDTDYFTSICGEAKDGKYVIDAKVIDNAGNPNTCTITYYLDKKNPVIDRIDFAPETADGKANTSEFIEELKYGYYFKTDFNVTINVSDEGPSSGLYKVNYRFVPYENGQQQKAITGTKSIVDGKAQLIIPKGFKGQIFVEAFDCVNRTSGEVTAKAYVVDTSAPNIKIINNVNTDYHDADGNKLYVETNSFTVVVTDTVSGIKQIGYLQNSEKDPFERKTIDIAKVEHILEQDLGDGWIVTGVEANLVTQVTKVFTFATDNNDVMLIFDATDNSLNPSAFAPSDKFTVDKTAPIINVTFREDDDTDVYYNANRIADITVLERNFDASLINVAIENTFGSVPNYTFTENSKNEHTAVIDFDEGDYTFDLAGADLGDHNAIVNFSGGNEKSFYVDKTRPAIEENFSEFINSSENSFNADKTVNIRVVEHNFSPELMNLRIFRKGSGAEHSLNGFEDVTSELLGVKIGRAHV